MNYNVYKSFVCSPLACDELFIPLQNILSISTKPLKTLELRFLDWNTNY